MVEIGTKQENVSLPDHFTHFELSWSSRWANPNTQGKPPDHQQTEKLGQPPIWFDFSDCAKPTLKWFTGKHHANGKDKVKIKLKLFNLKILI